MGALVYKENVKQAYIMIGDKQERNCVDDIISWLRHS